MSSKGLRKKKTPTRLDVPLSVEGTSVGLSRNLPFFSRQTNLVTGPRVEFSYKHPGDGEEVKGPHFGVCVTGKRCPNHFNLSRRNQGPPTTR